jgi:D-glycero-D-manno-heptose 1,7-bisphosphate phosphatase
MNGTLPRLVILDRDGVINEDSDDFVKSPDEWIPIPGSLEAIARLNHAGILVAVATNQSGIARGLFTVDTLNQMHAKFQHALGRVGGHIDGIFFCPHGPDDGCECRKPKPGLLRSIGLRFGVPLAGVPFIGDTKRDVEAALAARALPVLVRSGKGALTFENSPELHQLPWFDDLADAVDTLLSGSIGHP